MGLNRKNCPNCGKFIRENSPFCIHCGKQLKEIELEEENGEKNIGVSFSVSKNVGLSQDADSLPERDQKTNINEETYYVEPVDDEVEVDEDEEKTEGKSEDAIKDDDAAFSAILGKTSKEDTGFTTSTSMNNKRDAKMVKAFANKVKTQKASDRNLFGQKKCRTNTNEETENIEDDKKEQICDDVDEYDPNYDRYYDNITAAVDARIEHIPKENIISTIFLALAFLVLVIFMIYFLVL